MSTFGGGSNGFGGGEAPLDVSLNLTALMDILSNLLFFLLASYSAQSVEVKTKPDMTLPTSSSQAKPATELVLTVTRREILVADVPIAQLNGAEITGTPVDDDKIGGLFDRLQTIKSTRLAAGRAESADGDIVMLLADKSTDSVVITKILKTAALAGFANIKFGVLAP